MLLPMAMYTWFKEGSVVKASLLAPAIEVVENIDVALGTLLAIVKRDNLVEDSNNRAESVVVVRDILFPITDKHS